MSESVMARTRGQLPERDRNRLLRRVDWRVLLVDPWPHRTACFAHGELAEALALVSAVVGDDTGGEGDCDLAVTTAPDAATLARAVTRLRPGGACWIEWPRRSFGALPNRRRQLEALGLVGVRFLAPWPSVASCHAWIPLEHPMARDYVLHAERAATRGAWGRLRALANEVRARLGMYDPLCALAYRPPATPFVPAVIAAAAGEGAECAPAIVLLTSGKASINKIVALAFDRVRTPAVAVKVSRVAESLPGLRQEAETLGALGRAWGGEVDGVPRLLATAECGTSFAVAESTLVGVPLAALIRRSTLRRLALQGTEWLARFAEAGPATHPASSVRSRVIEPALDTFEESFAPVLDPALVREMRVVVAALGDPPAVCEHRDFSPWNVHLTKRGLAVFDWESSEPCGIPALDLIYFLSYLAFYVDGAMMSRRFRRSYRLWLDGDTSTGRVRRECSERYMTRARVPADAMHALRLLTWVIHSRSDYVSLTAEAGGPPNADALRCSVFLGLWEEELRHGARA